MGIPLIVTNGKNAVNLNPDRGLKLHSPVYWAIISVLYQFRCAICLTGNDIMFLKVDLLSSLHSCSKLRSLANLPVVINSDSAILGNRNNRFYRIYRRTRLVTLKSKSPSSITIVNKRRFLRSTVHRSFSSIVA